MSISNTAEDGHTSLTKRSIYIASMAVDLQFKSPLFRLPAELRDRIYEQVAIKYNQNDQLGTFRTCR